MVNNTAYTQIQNFFVQTIPANYANAWKATVVSGSLCGAIAIESAICAIKDGAQMAIRSGDSKKLGESFSWNVASSLFFGICAANILPGTPLLGATLYVANTYFNGADQQSLYITQLTHSGFVLAERAIIWINNTFVKPFMDKIGWPLLTKIAEFTSWILSKVKLPENPVWYGVALLVVAIATVKIGLPAVGVNLL